MSLMLQKSSKTLYPQTFEAESIILSLDKLYIHCTTARGFAVSLPTTQGLRLFCSLPHLRLRNLGLFLTTLKTRGGEEF
ncbi:Uncharacterized protein HZ326_8091 [Fusarium oxysporum f. sp. albedinis]|nr:Uncharacterized protein HZ326_8091 [Fusarium oxysporum f. sp. albedinis]